MKELPVIKNFSDRANSASTVDWLFILSLDTTTFMTITIIDICNKVMTFIIEGFKNPCKSKLV